MYLELHDVWYPDLVDLHDYADNCTHWRQGVSMHILQQNTDSTQRRRVEEPEFPNPRSRQEFAIANDQPGVRCRSSLSGAEMAEHLLSKLVAADRRFAHCSYIVYCHRGMDLEFYSSPACRMQYAIGNRAAIPFAVSQAGTLAGHFGLYVATSLARFSRAPVVIVGCEVGISPARRRVFSDALVDDGVSVMRVLPDPGHALDPARILQLVDGGVYRHNGAGDVLEATEFANLTLSVLEERPELPVQDVTIIAPWLSTRFARALSKDPRLRGRLILQGDGAGYAGINFPYFAVERFLDTSGYHALLVQSGELGGFGWHLLKRTASWSAQ